MKNQKNIIFTVFEDGEEIGKQEVDIFSKKDIRNKLSNWFEIDKKTEIDFNEEENEIYIGISETEYFWYVLEK